MDREWVPHVKPNSENQPTTITKSTRCVVHDGRLAPSHLLVLGVRLVMKSSSARGQAGRGLDSFFYLKPNYTPLRFQSYLETKFNLLPHRTHSLYRA